MNVLYEGMESMKGKQNKGFTLIEVLVAMTILSIVVVPMLHAFVTSARTNAKAKSLLGANALSQSIMEELKAGDLDTVAAGYTAYNGEDEEITYEPEKDSYILKKTGVASGSNEYDVKLLLNKNASSGTRSLANIYSMDRDDCGYFVQVDNMDAKAAANFKIKNDTYVFNAVAQKTASEFEAMMNRTITVTLKDNGTVQSAEVSYAYQIPEGYTPTEDCKYAEGEEIYNNIVTKKALKAVYLFYFPRYGNGIDTIRIDNQADLEIPVFIVKMDMAQPETFQPEMIPTLAVQEGSVAADGKTHAVICTNLETGEYFAASSAIRISDLGNGLDAVTLYDVTIEVYKQGETAFDPELLLASYKGSCMVGSSLTEE